MRSSPWHQGSCGFEVQRIKSEYGLTNQLIRMKPQVIGMESLFPMVIRLWAQVPRILEKEGPRVVTGVQKVFVRLKGA